MNDLIEKLSDLRSQFNCFDENKYEAYRTLSEAIKVISEPPESCEDAVSRRRLLSDLKELIAAWKKYPVMAEQIKGVETAIGYVKLIPSVMPKQVPYEDTISRKSILDKISKKDNWEKYDRYNLGLSDARRIVQDEPSVTPKPKTGKWIRKGEEIVCDKCGYSLYDVLSNIRLSQGSSYVYIPVYYDFCPKCGADMRGEQDGR